MLVTGQHRTVVQAFAQRDLLMGTHRLAGKILITRVCNKHLDPVSGIALLHAVGRHISFMADEFFSHCYIS